MKKPAKKKKPVSHHYLDQADVEEFRRVVRALRSIAITSRQPPHNFEEAATRRLRRDEVDAALSNVIKRLRLGDKKLTGREREARLLNLAIRLTREEP